MAVAKFLVIWKQVSVVHWFNAEQRLSVFPLDGTS
jgi:hypothetical protein